MADDPPAPSLAEQTLAEMKRSNRLMERIAAALETVADRYVLDVTPLLPPPITRQK